MKGRWESDINVWFRLMYSQEWNCVASFFPKQNITYYNILPTNFQMQMKGLVPIYVFPGMKLRGLVIAKTEL